MDPCPSDDDVSAFVEGRLVDFETVLEHLADCAGCLSLVAMLMSTDPLEPSPPPP